MSEPQIDDQTTAGTKDDGQVELVRAVDDPVVLAEIARIFRAARARRLAREAAERKPAA